MALTRSVTIRGANDGASNLLTWTPPGYPSYTGYTTINIANDGSNRVQTLNNSTDYVINIDDYVSTLNVTLIGGRNVVVIGGRITITDNGTVTNRVGLALRPRSNAYYHIEGLQIRPDPATPTGLLDALALQRSLQGGEVAPTAASRVVVQNCRLGTVSIRQGDSDGTHADCYQLQADYEGQVWMDRVSMLSDYTGMMLGSSPTCPLHKLKRVNVRPVDANTTYQYAYGFYQTLRAQAVEFVSGVYVDPRSGQTFGGSAGGIYPHNSAAGGRSNSPEVFAEDACTVTTDGTGTYATWPASSGITGACYRGQPAGGDYCTESDCGPAYVSPGYL